MGNTTLALTMGAADGIGPEVVVKALSSAALRRADIVVVGDQPTLSAWAKRLRKPLPSRIVHLDAARSAGGLEYARIAHEMAHAGGVSGIVTGPIRKQRGRAGKSAQGHTELLSAWAGCVPVATMMMVAPRLKVSLVTTHVPLASVSRHLSKESILRAILRTELSLREDFGIEHPRIVVLGLNPHAGESGKLGTEEGRVIGPAIAAAVKRGVHAEGPASPDAVFHFLVRGKWDAAIAMYHDQGLIAAKLAGFGESVNVSLGLPYVRTSVDHGTADDIAGKGIADAASLQAAITLARQMVRRRRALEAA